MVRKAKGGWRMRQDYTDLKKACPNDGFPLPRIDQLVDATAGHELLSFMDAYSGYNQIFMNPADSEHMSFITDRGLYLYNVMPFGLKNAGATYQRLVNRSFAEHISSIMEVYVDDILVNIRTTGEHLDNLALMFGILKDYRMRLNPTKCAFGVSSGKFLSFMISQRGIEANPEKIKAIIDMKMPKTQKDIQSLIGRVAALTRFISKATDKCVPFFKALNEGKQHITWTAECDKAFQDLKNYISKALLLSKPLPGEVLFLYLSVFNTAVSSVLIRKLEKAELPIFYVREFDIQFKPRPVEKGQAVADFISELSPFVAQELASSDADAGDPGKTSNNEAEYEALLAGLWLAKSMSAKQISIHSDSQLIVNQITAYLASRDASMTAYLSTTHRLLKTFQTYEIRQIPRMENSHADALA
ncbi:hypothetical protein L3X38_004962 [Prunus dulcis]|uniref:Reverse transcriptase domain-containing protein n=1 Tax=Prunus dulcis TaxID=3755 RepID=A0AAD4ZQ35_PRUDU|nr:hypothetical protein L3X38_004962 [Prunus dulcis]